MIVRPNWTSTSFNMLSSPSSKHLCCSASFHPLLHTPLSPSLLQLVTSYPAIIHSGSCLSLVPLVSSTSSVLCQSPSLFLGGEKLTPIITQVSVKWIIGWVIELHDGKHPSWAERTSELFLHHTSRSASLFLIPSLWLFNTTAAAGT